MYFVFVSERDFTYLWRKENINMKEIYSTDISELPTFEKYGETFTLIERNEENNTYLYKRTNKETGKVSYEVIKPIKRKNPDGTTVYCYPSESSFGYGVALYTPIFAKALKYLENGCQRIS